MLLLSPDDCFDLRDLFDRPDEDFFLFREDDLDFRLPFFFSLPSLDFDRRFLRLPDRDLDLSECLLLLLDLAVVL